MEFAPTPRCRLLPRGTNRLIACNAASVNAIVEAM